MKLRSIITITAIVALASCGTPYQATSTGDVARSSFSVQYPNAINPEWSRYDMSYVPIDWELAGWPTLDNSAYLVKFNQDNNSYYAWYDENGNWIGSTYSISDYNTLPSAVNTTLSDKYSGYTITKVNREFQHDRIAYEIELSNNDMRKKVLIDTNGNVIKEKNK
jgi:hypothetical protein